jgi:hypothetical protein
VKDQQLFCSACDRQVRVLLTDTPSDDGQAEVHDEELVCIEIGSHCTGSLCPLGASEPSAMVNRIVRNGIPLGTLETVVAHCPACDITAEMILYGEGKAACSVCGNISRWVFDHLE